MPWTTPTLKEVRTMTRDYVLGQLGARTMVPNSVLRIMSDSKSALAHLTLRYIDWLSRQFLPLTAETEWLDRHANIWLVNSDGSLGRKAATFAQGSVLVDGVAGFVVPNGTILDGQNNLQYETTEEATLGVDPVAAAVRCLTAGEAGNLDDGDSFSTPAQLVGGVESITASGIDGGTDEENDDDLRERVLQRIRNPPMGGAAHDYVRWALAVPGVTRAWAYPNEMGIGTVTVRFLMDDRRADAYGIPTEDDLDEVRAYLDTVRPVAVKDIFVVAPIPYPYSLTITQLSKNDATVRARIEAALRTMDRTRSKPGQTLYRAWVDEAVSGAVGEDYHELEFDTLAMPNNGSMPVLGSITYAS